MGRIIQKNLTGLLGSVEDSVVIADWNLVIECMLLYEFLQEWSLLQYQRGGYEW